MTPVLQKLKQRKIAQWGIAYAASAWVALQVIEFLSETYHWPPTLLRVLPIVLLGGLLLVLVLAWFHGEAGEQKFAPLELVLVSSIVLLTGAAAFLIGNRPDGVASGDDVAGKSVAVLPFASLSGGDENAYFASGIHDELLTQLTQLGELKVISRTSVLAYKNTDKSIREIARELGVAAVLEGSVQRAGNRVRVQAQLIDAKTDNHLWAERYDRELTDVFAIQSDIAQQIATALNARLSTTERATLNKRPTANADAYDAYLRARQYHTIPGQGPGNLEAAIKLYERAISLDPNFALAHAWLSQANGAYRWFAYESSDARLPIQQREAETALRLDPTLPEAHAALGLFYYWGRRDYVRAIDEFARGLRLAPGNTDLMVNTGFVNRRQGNFTETLRMMQQATKLDPRNVDYVLDGIGNTSLVMHRYADAIAAYRKALALAPDYFDGKVILGWTYFDAEGQLDTIRAYLNAPVPAGSWYENPEYHRFKLEFYAHDFNAALRAAERAPDVMQNQELYYTRTLLKGWAYQKLNDARARAAFDSARIQFEQAARQTPNDYRLAIALGFAYAGLGRNGDAIREATRARELLQMSIDAFQAPRIAHRASEVLAQAGAKAEAIALIEELLPKPGTLTVNELRVNPLYDPLRADARFRKLIAQ